MINLRQFTISVKLLGLAVAIPCGLFAQAAQAVENFAMLSGYKLYYDFSSPTEVAVLDSAIQDLRDRNASALVYGSIGFSDYLARGAAPPRNAPLDENAYNRQLLTRIRDKNVSAWLQLRVMDNRLCIGSDSCTAEQMVNVTAADILTNKIYRQAFLRKARSVIANYNSLRAGACKVILFEEETLYHSKDGSGYFWSGAEASADNVWNYADQHVPRLIKPSGHVGAEMLEPSSNFDLVFIDRFVKLYRMLAYQVKAVNPDCEIGIHMGHQPVYQTINVNDVNRDFAQLFALSSTRDKLRAGDNTVYKNIVDLIPMDGSTSKPHFVMYDLYLKASLTEAIFLDKLQGRLDLLLADQPAVQVYYLAQAHTMNYFQHGVGRTPSRAQLANVAQSAYSRGIAGFGYYGKNAVYSLCYTRSDGTYVDNNEGTPRTYCSREEDADAFDPNLRGGPSMVFQTSPARWRFALDLFR